jgi:hypothetical protein
VNARPAGICTTFPIKRLRNASAHCFSRVFQIIPMSSIAKMLRTIPHSFSSDHRQAPFAGLALAGPSEAISPRGTLSQAELRRIVADMVG